MPFQVGLVDRADVAEQLRGIVVIRVAPNRQCDERQMRIVTGTLDDLRAWPAVLCALATRRRARSRTPSRYRRSDKCARRSSSVPVDYAHLSLVALAVRATRITNDARQLLGYIAASTSRPETASRLRPDDTIGRAGVEAA